MISILLLHLLYITVNNTLYNVVDSFSNTLPALSIYYKCVYKMIILYVVAADPGYMVIILYVVASDPEYNMIILYVVSSDPGYNMIILYVVASDPDIR